MEANMDWDTDDVQDRSRTPSPSAGIGTITLGESTEDTPPARQNMRLVTERVIEPGAVPPQENAPEAEEKTQGDGDDTPPDDKSPNLGVKVISLTCTCVPKNCRAFYDILDNVIIPY